MLLELIAQLFATPAYVAGVLASLLKLQQLLIRLRLP